MAIFTQQKIDKFKQQANVIFNRAIDQHVNLAVTGLSRSGKTAFITSLVNQLLNEGTSSQLSFFEPVYQGRFIAAKRVKQKHIHIPRFDYEDALQSFCQEHHELQLNLGLR